MYLSLVSDDPDFDGVVLPLTRLGPFPGNPATYAYRYEGPISFCTQGEVRIDCVTYNHPQHGVIYTLQGFILLNCCFDRNCDAGPFDDSCTRWTYLPPAEFTCRPFYARFTSTFPRSMACCVPAIYVGEAMPAIGETVDFALWSCGGCIDCPGTVSITGTSLGGTRFCRNKTVAATVSVATAVQLDHTHLSCRCCDRVQTPFCGRSYFLNPPFDCIWVETTADCTAAQNQQTGRFDIGQYDPDDPFQVNDPTAPFVMQMWPTPSNSPADLCDFPLDLVLSA